MLHNLFSSGDNLLLMDARGRPGHWILKRQGGEVCGPSVMDQKGIAVLWHVVEGNLCRFFFHLMFMAIQKQAVELLNPLGPFQHSSNCRIIITDDCRVDNIVFILVSTIICSTPASGSLAFELPVTWFLEQTWCLISFLYPIALSHMLITDLWFYSIV